MQYCTYTEERKEKNTEVENVNVDADPILLPWYFKLSPKIMVKPKGSVPQTFCNDLCT